ncbi:RabGAP/TBC [Hesseltinella vesiculosa]|uniref:RabGAP/TBC n=1 Tax=Hesseltinella vesiculosa TaxID=101127 RepID=A0A1X2G5E4_9FUNG|nr:RabGAP/TBC [Hesseltinella vesiculosa]
MQCKTVSRSFWRRKGLKLPGSVRIVPREQGTDGSGQNDGNQPLVIGARYAYTSIVTHQQSSVHKSTSSQSNMPSTRTSKSSTTHSTQHKTARHKHSGSTPKSFNAFLEDTNDEWDDSMDEKKDYVLATSTMTLEDTSPSPASSTPPAPNKSEPANQPLATSSSTPSTTPVLAMPVPASQDTLLEHSSLTMAPPEPSQVKPVDANGMIDNIQSVLKDPSHTLCLFEAQVLPEGSRMKRFVEILANANGYLPCNSERRVDTLARKRKEYSDSVKASYARGTAGLDQALAHQIHIDILRTNPNCLERILYQWAIRHPASGYVQGINDLVTPIFEVFLSAYIGGDPEGYDVAKLDQQVLDVIEADSFWCLSKLLDGIQDNYTFAQPGIQRQIVTLKDLVSRIDSQLAHHLEQEGVEFIQFAFRWMNCLLMRELPLKTTIRMWDTYLAEGSSEGFSAFHVYVCAAFLVKWSSQLRKMDFQEIMIFLQQLPTCDWQEKDVEILLSEAFMWKSLFQHAPSHLKSK